MGDSSRSLQLQPTKTPRIVFVTGGPGTGKGTQCAKLVEEFGFKHVSIGDLVRAEIRNGSEIGRSIEAITKQGNLVPKEVVVGLLAQTLANVKGHTLLIDGFPRDIQQAAYLEQLGVHVDYILHFEAEDDEVLLNRLIERGKTSGRADDTEEVITHRFRVYKAESLPVLHLYEPFGVIRKVSCMGTIPEVFSRTVLRLRPEILCVIGPIYSGKTTVVNLLTQRHKFRALSFGLLRAAHPTVSDEEIVRILVKKIAAMKRDNRVVIDSFPQNLTQARFFATMSGEPDRVLYMYCSKETSQMRHLKAGKTVKDISPAQVGTRYLDFSTASKPLLSYLRSKLSTRFIEGNSENHDQVTICESMMHILEPEVVVVRGQVAPCFLQFLKDRRGYTLINVCNLMRLWRLARGLSASERETELGDDPEVIDVLRNAMYSGAGAMKYALYNFSLGSLNNYRAFIAQVASIRRVFYLYKSPAPDSPSLQAPEMEDSCTKELFYIERKLEPIQTNLLSKTLDLQDEDSRYFDKVLKDGELRTTAKLIVVEGPTKSGKTSIAKFLASKYSFRLLDCNAVVEETKKRLSTEDEPKDALTFTEFGEGLQVYLRDNKAQTFVLEGLPPAEILSYPGGKAFKDLEAVEAGGEDDDPDVLTLQKLKPLLSRWTQFVKTYLGDSMSVLIRTKCSEPELIRRLKVAGEIPEADELPADAKNDLYESQVLSSLLAAASPYFPKSLQMSRTVEVDTRGLAVSDLHSLLRARFDTRLIIVRTTFESTIDLMRHICWVKQAFFCNFTEAVTAALARRDELGQEARRGQMEGGRWEVQVKMRMVKEFVEAKRLDEMKMVVLCNYPFTVEPNYPRPLDELLQMESFLGTISALVTFTPEYEKDEIELPDLPVRIRKVKKPLLSESQAQEEGEEEEEGKDSQRQAVQVTAQEPESPVPVWNNNEATNLTMAFQYFKGQEANCRRGEMPDVNPMPSLMTLLSQLWEPGPHWNLQLYTTAAFDRALSNDLNLARMSFSVSNEYFEPLPIDLTGMGKATTAVSRVLTNDAAKDFYQKFMKVATVPFSTFFAGFSQVLNREGVPVTPGLRSAVHAHIDRKKNGCVTAEDVNAFFATWENAGKKAEIVSLGQQKDAKAKRSNEGFKLVLVVLSATPDPMTSVTSFQRGQQFTITDSGCPTSKRYCADRCTLIGRENSQSPNDIDSHSADTRVRNNHFSILSKKDGYFLVDHGGMRGIQIRVSDFPMVLFREAVVRLGETLFHVVKCDSKRPPKRDPLAYSYMDYRNISTEDVSEESVLKLEFLSGSLHGVSYTFDTEQHPIVRLGAAEDNDIVLASGEAYHARIEYRDAGWVLLAVQSPSETWVYVNSWVGMKEDRASHLVRVTNGSEVAMPGAVFKAVFKSDINFQINLSDFLEIRRVSFKEVYCLGVRLGYGGYSEVHECVHLSSRTKYAVKIMRKTNLSKSDMFEMTSLKHLDHPNIVKVHDMIENERFLFIVTDLCAGGELFDRILARGKFTETMAASTVRDIARAVTYLHSKNIAHRDLKPENLIYVVDEENSPLKLVDFGAAKVIKEGKPIVERIGTPYYVAPEVLQGKGDLRSDMWSIGVILHVLLCGSPPFIGRSDKEILDKVVNGKVEFLQPAWEQVSKSAKRLVSRLLSRDPAQRPSALDVLEDPWVQGTARNVNYEGDLAEKALTSFKSFNASNKLQQAVMLFIASNFLSADEEAFARQLFTQMDRDGSGKLSKEEIVNGMKQVSMEMSDADYQEMMKEVDANMSGVVDYTEFVAAVVTRHKLLSRERLEKVFQVFDQDGSGDITAAELKATLGQTEEKWTKLIAQVDQNQDGKIDLKEFKNLMLSFLA